MLRTFAAALVMGVSTAAIVFAGPLQDPQTAGPTTRLIPFTASLPNADAAAGGPRSVTFALYDDAEGGTRLWSEMQVVNADARGRYTAYLGAAQALPIEIFRTEQARWLEVAVDGRAMPRVMLVAVPYALRAADAETLAGRPLSEFVLTDANGRRVRTDGTTVDDPAVDGTGVPNKLDVRAPGSAGVVSIAGPGRGVEGESTGQIGVAGFSTNGLAGVLGSILGTALGR